MPRPKLPAPSTERAQLHEDHIAEDLRAVDADAARRNEIVERYGDGLPYDRLRVVDRARFYMAQGAAAMLEAGKCLIQMKEFEEHGDFERIVEELGMSPRTARNMMAAAVRFLALKDDTAASDKLLTLGVTKLYDLALLEDEELKELAKGKTVAGLQLDEIESMSSRELRAHLREAKQQLDAKDAVIELKDKKINKLLEKDAGKQPWQIQFEKALEQTSEAFNRLQLACAEVARVAEEIEGLELEAVAREADALALRAQIANHFYDRSEAWLEQGAGLIVAARADHIEALLALARKRLPDDVKRKLFGEA